MSITGTDKLYTGLQYILCMRKLQLYNKTVAQLVACNYVIFEHTQSNFRYHVTS